MKKTILILVLAFFAYTGFSQTNTLKIRVDATYSKNDTTNSFSVTGQELDKCKDKLIKLWGTPKHITIGLITWENIKIDGVGTNLTIDLVDGVIMKENNEYYHKCFTDEADKAAKLKNMKSDQYRMISISVCDKTAKNIINSKPLTAIVKKILESALL